MLDKIGGAFRDYAPLVLRLGLGIIFFYHGSQKLLGIFGGPGLSGFAAGLEKMGFSPPMLWAVLAAVAEFLGGIFVALGFLTRWAAAGLVVVMLVAIFKAHAGDPFSQVEFALACLTMALALFFTGGGKGSLDLRIKVKKES
jgi:putative oxidoreductase